MAKLTAKKDQDETKEIEVSKEEEKPVAKKDETVRFVAPNSTSLTLILEVKLSPKMANRLQLKPSNGLVVKFQDGVYITSDKKTIDLIRQTTSYKEKQVLEMPND